MKESRVLQALEALAENDRRIAVPPIVEARVIQAFRARPSTRTFPRVAAFSVAAAAALAAVILVHHRPPHIVAQPSAATRAVAVPTTAIETPTAVAHAVPSPKPRPLPKPTRGQEQNATRQEQNGTRQVQNATRQVQNGIRQERAAREVVTDFFPLMDPAPPFDRGEILRVQLPASALQAVGLPVADDHRADQIQADVLVGEEGLPRAIRFIGLETK